MSVFTQANHALSTLELMESALELGEKDLKGAKEVVNHLAEKALPEYKTRLVTLGKVRTKKAFGELVGTFREYVAELEKQSYGTNQLETLGKLEAYAVRVEELLAARMQNTLDLGLVLTEAKDQFKKQADFLKWAKEACNLGKSQVYKWIKVYEVFGAEPAFGGVSMRVLYDLAALGNESQEFRAAEQLLDDGGTLDLPALKEIIAHCNPEPEPTVKTELDLVEAGDSDTTQITVEPEQDDEGQESDDTDAPFDTDSVDDLFRPIGDTEEPETAPQSAPAPAQADSRDDLIKALQEQIKALTAELAKANQPAPAPQMATLPALPQFSIDCPYAVLGLSEKLGASEAEVKKAHRGLAKLYSNQPEISAKLMEARNQLLGK